MSRVKHEIHVSKRCLALTTYLFNIGKHIRTFRTCGYFDIDALHTLIPFIVELYSTFRNELPKKQTLTEKTRQTFLINDVTFVVFVFGCNCDCASEIVGDLCLQCLIKQFHLVKCNCRLVQHPVHNIM